MSDRKYVYTGDGKENFTDAPPTKLYPSFQTELEADPNAGLVKKRGASWETNFTFFRSVIQVVQRSTGRSLRRRASPNLPHIRPFADKPHLLLLSLLYTRDLGLHLPPDQPNPKVLRPRFWFWINPGPVAFVPNPNNLRDMLQSLKTSPWASPFMHLRIGDVIQFRLWNTTEQLDGIPELKDERGPWKANCFTLVGTLSGCREKKKGASSSPGSPP